MQRDHVGLGEERGEIGQPDAEAPRVIGRGIRVGGEQARIPVGEPAGHVGADAAEPDQAHRLAEEEVAAVPPLRPFAPAELGLVVLDPLLQHEHEADGRLGDGDEVLGRGAIGHQHAEAGGGADVDLVGADEGHDHEPEVARGLEDGGADGLEVRGEDHVGVAGRRDQLALGVGHASGRVEGAADDHLVAGLTEGTQVLGAPARTGHEDLHRPGASFGRK